MKATEARSRNSLISFGATALLALGAATAQVAIAAGTGMSSMNSTGIDNSGNYQSEVQACLSGRTQQDQATCLKEARNARADKQRGVLDTAGDLQANAVARCDVFTTSDDKTACQSRVMGMGSTEGSVAGGGMLRELEVPAGSTSTLGNR